MRAPTMKQMPHFAIELIITNFFQHGTGDLVEDPVEDLVMALDKG